MKILVTGAKGFVGRNLCSQLNNIKTGKAKCYGDLQIDEVFEYDLNSTMEQLDAWCSECDFVFNLAGVNRPQNPEEFMAGNFGFASTLLDTLKKHGNKAPVMLSSSAQASLSGRFGNSEYGRSKKAGEDLFLRYGAENGIKVLVYRFPNLYGKWCRPNYNSAIATFCNNIANDLPITVNDPKVELEVLYIDDLVEEMIAALKGQEHHCEFEGLTVLPSAEGRYCYCPVTHKATLGEIVGLLHQFRDMPKTLMIPEIPAEAIREAVANALCHRDYTTGTAVEVNVFMDTVQIVSPGLFPEGDSPQEHLDGTASEFGLRNPAIARTLFRAGVIEQYGTGIPRIKEACEAAGVRFRFEQTVNSTVVVFERPGLQKAAFRRTAADNRPLLSERERAAMAIAAAQGKITTSDLARESNVGRKTASKTLKDLAGRGLLEWVGKSPKDPHQFYRMPSEV